MAEKKPQTFANHARFDPLFHFLRCRSSCLLPFVGAANFSGTPSLHAEYFSWSR